jgi:UDP-N-acetylmuramoyl-L-alanyl-D-glutamate--2,6-diaminopimelate ligase
LTGYLRQTLRQLFEQIPTNIDVASLPSIPITGLAIDSRQVQSGQIFVALTGGNVDGHQFIPNAIQEGAVAVVGSRLADPAWKVPYIQVDNPRNTLAWLSAAFYRFPARRMNVIGVTGTDGKTTTSNLIYEILLAAGRHAGIVSTVNAVIGDEVVDTGFHVTTPEAPDVQKYLSRMVAAGLTDVVLETTSHGLAQERVTGCEFDIGVVTNITHEHLDYHGSYENYRAAKARLFSSLSETSEKPGGNKRTAILNKDDISYEYLAGITRVHQVSYGLMGDCDIWAEEIISTPGGTNFVARSKDWAFPVSCKLVGLYNVSNCLAAIGATIEGMGLPRMAAQQGIASLPGIPGRMEVIHLGQSFTAIVDFAHTPNALKRALETARTLTNGRIIAVFGSAGLRDREKRRMMAEVAAELADVSILTAEDPRTESLDDILAEMAFGAVSRDAVEGQTFMRIADRPDAIRTACRMADPGDLVISCGKGHEQSMCFGEIEYLWDDRIAMKAALAELLGKPGPEMPKLPTSTVSDK